MYRGSFFLQGKRNYEYTPAGFLLQPLQSSFLFSLFSLPLDWTIWAEHQTPSGSAGRTGHWVGRPAMALPPPKLSSWLTHDHHSDKDQEMIQELSPHGSDTAMTMIWQYAKWINLCEMIRPRSLYGRSWSRSSSSPWSLSSQTTIGCHNHQSNQGGSSQWDVSSFVGSFAPVCLYDSAVCYRAAKQFKSCCLLPGTGFATAVKLDC